MTSLLNTVIFITGASSGMGRSCACAFAEADAKLTIIARRINRLKDLAAELKREFNTETFIYDVDVLDHHP